MMKDEVKRVMQLVKDGKLSPEDAAELIEAFENSVDADPEATSEGEAPASEQEAGSTGAKAKDPFGGLIETLEKVTKDVAKSIDWNNISSQVRQGTKKGVEAVKEAVEQARQGKSPFGFLFNSELKVVELPLSVDSKKVLKIENLSGDIKVIGGAELSSVVAHANIRGATAEDAKNKAELYTLMIEESDHFVLIRQPDMSGLSVDLEIQLSSKPSVEIKSGSGDVRVENTKNGCRVNSKSGDVSLSGLNGPIEVNTSSGSVKVSESKASSLNLENHSGDILISDVRGNMNVRTESGNVHIEASSGRTISIEAISGDVKLDLDEAVEGVVNVRTVQGDTALAISDNCNCRVALSTLRGMVSSAIELQDTARSETRITGTLGDGTGTIDVSAISGDIVLTQRAHSAS